MIPSFLPQPLSIPIAAKKPQSKIEPLILRSFVIESGSSSFRGNQPGQSRSYKNFKKRGYGKLPCISFQNDEPSYPLRKPDFLDFSKNQWRHFLRFAMEPFKDLKPDHHRWNDHQMQLRHILRRSGVACKAKSVCISLNVGDGGNPLFIKRCNLWLAKSKKMHQMGYLVRYNSDLRSGKLERLWRYPKIELLRIALSGVYEAHVFYAESVKPKAKQFVISVRYHEVAMAGASLLLAQPGSCEDLESEFSEKLESVICDLYQNKAAHLRSYYIADLSREDVQFLEEHKLKSFVSVVARVCRIVEEKWNPVYSDVEVMEFSKRIDFNLALANLAFIPGHLSHLEEFDIKLPSTYHNHSLLVPSIIAGAPTSSSYSHLKILSIHLDIREDYQQFLADFDHLCDRVPHLEILKLMTLMLCDHNTLQNIQNDKQMSPEMGLFMICDYNLKCIRDKRIMRIMIDAVTRVKTLKDLHLSFVKDRSKSKEVSYAKIFSTTPEHIQRYNCDNLLEKDEPALELYNIHNNLKQSNLDQPHLDDDDDIHKMLSDVTYFDELFAPTEMSPLNDIVHGENKRFIPEEYNAMKKRSQPNEYMSYYNLLQILRMLLRSSSLKSFSFGCSILCHTLELQTLLFIMQEVQLKSMNLLNIDLKCRAVEERDLIKLKKKIKRSDCIKEMSINKIQVFYRTRAGTRFWGKDFKPMIVG